MGSLESIDLVRRIKEAIRQADLGPLLKGDIAVVGIEIDLKLETERTVGGDVKFTIPIINVELGTSLSRGWANMDHLHIELAAPGQAKALIQSEDPIVTGLASAASTVFAFVATAQMAEPVYDLKQATYALSFVVTDKGTISLVFKGEAAKEASQVITFKFERYNPSEE